jgi:hypothetical protein
MRTTVDIPDAVYRQLKARAALQGCSVRQLLLRGVEAELNGKQTTKSGHRVRLPIIESKRRRPLRLTNERISEILFP